MNFSEYQLRLFSAYQNSGKNIVISAGPGSGKTTSVIAMLKHKHPNRSAIFLSFSRAIVSELKNRLPTGIQASTVHGACFRSLMKHYGGCVVVDEEKTIRFAFQTLSKVPEVKGRSGYKQYVISISKWIDHYRLFLCKTFDDIQVVASYMGDDVDEDMYTHMMVVLEAIEKYHKSSFTKSNPLRVDFIDQLFLTYKNKIPIQQYDDVIIDECQDCSLLQQLLILRMVKKGGRFIAVGDPKQAIFGFIGSDPHAFENWKNQPNTVELEFPISYRCSKEVVRCINTIYPGVVPFDSTNEGSITQGSIDDAVSGDFVLCRTNAPLFDCYFHLSSQGKKCYIRDNDFTKRLLTLTEPYKNVASPSVMVSGFAEQQIELIEQLKVKGCKYPTSHKKYEELKELITIAQDMLEYCDNNVGRIVEVLSHMLKQDEKDAIQLITFHKSKGLESENVFMVRLDKWPSKYAGTSEQILQERNLLFVALSRSKNRVIIDTDFTASAKQTVQALNTYRTIIKRYETDDSLLENSDIAAGVEDSEQD